MKTVLLTRSEPLIVEFNDTYFFRHGHTQVDGTENLVEAREAIATIPHATYETLVAGLIHTKYSPDAETAILANYLADPNNEAHKAEFDEYQACRAEVKTACKEYYNID